MAICAKGRYDRSMKLSWKLGITSFIGGFSLMTYELAAARILAPSVGSSTYVWTGVIGVIILALSLGCWLGGRLADRRQAPQDISLLLLVAAALVATTLLFSKDILDWLVVAVADPRWQAVFSALLLFAPASFMLGMVSPYLAKLNVSSLDTAGRSVANLGTLDAIGGIAGTFITGFFLFGAIGLREALVLVICILLAASWVFMPRWRWRLRSVLASVILAAALCGLRASEPGVVSIETPSAHYSVVDFKTDGKLVRGLMTGPSGVQSGIYLDGGRELPFWYTRQMVDLTVAAKPSNILLLGGGAFTMAENLAKQLPAAQVDVVEIDPALERISEQYFRYQPLANVKLIFEDARTYIQHADKHYDVVLVDVYSDGEVPFSLLTAEYGRELARIVKDDGLVVANLIAGLNSAPCRALFAAFDAVYRQTWQHAWYAAQNPNLSRTNYIIAYSKRAKTMQKPMSQFTSLGGKLYTDNFIPSDQLYENCRTSAL